VVIVVGAGPAGLATAASLARRGIRCRLLERGDALGYSWTRLYDSLRLHTGKHLSHLPGARFGHDTPLFPSRTDFLGYLQEYARRFALPVETGMHVVRATRENAHWLVQTACGEQLEASVLVMATGIIGNPRRPVIPGSERYGGKLLHSVEYRRPNEYVGSRVLVVGVGNSGGEIGAELARAGAHVTVAVRSGANVVPLAIAGVPIQYIAYVLRGLPRGAREFIVERVRRVIERKRGPAVLPRPSHSPLDAIPLIGFHLVDAIREGLIDVKLAGIAQLTESGVRYSDGAEEPFDAVIFATGFAAALAPLGTGVRTDARGFALRRDRITSADHDGLYFVGHNYDSTGGLCNIRRDARLVAERLARLRS
jgi:cation diffusion facilitator CzcD-associated flavoprotein CzcO